MNLKLAILTALIPVQSFAFNLGLKHRVLWVPTNRSATIEVLKSEFGLPNLSIIVPPMGVTGQQNPFQVSSGDFNSGISLPYPLTSVPGPVPQACGEDCTWFKETVKKKQLPDIFLIGGHHVISEGWHNDPETKFIYHPTLKDTLSRDQNARKIFDSVKLAILWGCNTMTNLEPHGEDGRFLSSDEIQAIYQSGPEGRARMIGSGKKTNTLEFYKSRLAREYGPNSASYEYTRDAKEEKCEGPGEYQNCKVTNLERILPEKMLFDGEHILNEPLRQKQLFPKAYLVLGYSSASPSEEARAKILRATLDAARAELNFPANVSPFHVILDPKTDEALRIRTIESVRKQWTIHTYKMNRNRPSGSITPAYPALDQNGIFNVNVSADTPLFAPYEERYSPYIR